MDTRTLYGKKLWPILALVPENPGMFDAEGTLVMTKQQISFLHWHLTTV